MTMKDLEQQIASARAASPGIDDAIATAAYPSTRAEFVSRKRQNEYVLCAYEARLAQLRGRPVASPAPSPVTSPALTPAVVARPQVPRTRPAWIVGKWGDPSGSCETFKEYREDGQYFQAPGEPLTAHWHVEGARMIHDLSKGESEDWRFGFEVEPIDENHIKLAGFPYVRCGSLSNEGQLTDAEASDSRPALLALQVFSQSSAAQQTAAQLLSPATATVRVRLAGHYGTRCVTPSVRNVRRPQEADPHPTNWVGEWVLTNRCPTAQWVRIEVDGTDHIFWAGLQTPGFRMQPSPRLVPTLPFTAISEFDFRFGWLVPANSEFVTGISPVSQQAVDRGLDVWIASCDGTGDARKQAIYLSAPFRNNPRVACYNHALPNGGMQVD